MKIWLLLSILNCHECIDSSIQSYLVMESCPSLTVSYFHELLNITSSLALSRRPNSSIQSCHGMKVQLYPPVLACHDCIDSSIQSYLVKSPLQILLVWSCHEDLTLSSRLAIHEILNHTSWSCQLRLESLVSGLVIYASTLYFWSCQL